MLLEKVRKEEWEEVLVGSEQGTIFHRWDWLKIVEKHTGFKLLPLMAFKGSNPIALYPIFFKRKLAFSPPPKSAIPYLGPAFVEYSKLKEDKRLSLFVDVQREMERLLSKFGMVVIDLPRGLKDCRPFKWNGYGIDPIFHYILKLDENVWSGFKKEFRENVKRSIKRGVTVEEGDLDFVYDSLKELYESRGEKLRISKSYIKDVYDALGNRAKVFVARKDSEPLIGTIVLLHRETVQFWVGGAKPKVRGVYPNETLHWEVMKWAMRNGYTEFEEFGAGTERLAKFKSKYNPKLEVCFRARRSNGIMNVVERVYRRVRGLV